MSCKKDDGTLCKCKNELIERMANCANCKYFALADASQFGYVAGMCTVANKGKYVGAVPVEGSDKCEANWVLRGEDEEIDYI